MELFVNLTYPIEGESAVLYFNMFHIFTLHLSLLVLA